jgi:hypothetical protein
MFHASMLSCGTLSDVVFLWHEWPKCPGKSFHSANQAPKSTRSMHDNARVVANQGPTYFLFNGQQCSILVLKVPFKMVSEHQETH